MCPSPPRKVNQIFLPASLLGSESYACDCKIESLMELSTGLSTRWRPIVNGRK